ncbi:MAG: TFIIB-type zinc ribbon-containing protein [Thermoprotei archaeon]|nr:MAG: TFIIB-type zinc ribbon-containing protein [Thermoprotei archaeon]
MGVLLCPVCLSRRVVLYLGGYAGKIYKCQDCGYVGPLILEVDEDEYKKLVDKMARHQAQPSVR